MCGTCGILWFDPDRPAERGALQEMARAIKHRGPDDEGFFRALRARLASRGHVIRDRGLVLAARLPSRLRLRGRAGKYILRQHALRLVPRAAIERPKHGFNVPLDEWLRGELRDLVRDMLTSARAASREFLNPRGVAQILAWHDRRVGNWGQHIWALLVFEIWCRMMAEATRTSSGALAGPRA